MHEDDAPLLEQRGEPPEGRLVAAARQLAKRQPCQRRRAAIRLCLCRIAARSLGVWSGQAAQPRGRVDAPMAVRIP